MKQHEEGIKEFNKFAESVQEIIDATPEFATIDSQCSIAKHMARYIKHVLGAGKLAEIELYVASIDGHNLYGVQRLLENHPEIVVKVSLVSENEGTSIVSFQADRLLTTLLFNSEKGVVKVLDTDTTKNPILYKQTTYKVVAVGKEKYVYEHVYEHHIAHENYEEERTTENVFSLTENRRIYQCFEKVWSSRGESHKDFVSIIYYNKNTGKQYEYLYKEGNKCEKLRELPEERKEGDWKEIKEFYLTKYQKKNGLVKFFFNKKEQPEQYAVLKQYEKLLGKIKEQAPWTKMQVPSAIAAVETTNPEKKK